MLHLPSYILKCTVAKCCPLPLPANRITMAKGERLRICKLDIGDMLLLLVDTLVNRFTLTNLLKSEEGITLHGRIST